MRDRSKLVPRGAYVPPTECWQLRLVDWLDERVEGFDRMRRILRVALFVVWFLYGLWGFPDRLI